MTVDVGKVVKIVIAGAVAALMGVSTYKKTGDAVDECAKAIKNAKEVTK